MGLFAPPRFGERTNSMPRKRRMSFFERDGMNEVGMANRSREGVFEHPYTDEGCEVDAEAAM
jgi:hypothetical protein